MLQPYSFVYLSNFDWTSGVSSCTSINIHTYINIYVSLSHLFDFIILYSGIIKRVLMVNFFVGMQVKWVRVLYSDFSAFTEDQERLISINGRKQKNALDFLEGMLLMNHGPINNWRSSFFPLSDHPRIASLITEHSILYCLEVAKYYDDQTEKNVDKVSSLVISHSS